MNPVRPGPPLTLVPTMTDAPIELRTEDELMLLTRGGMQAAFRVLVRRHQARVLRIASRYLRDPSLATDIAQTTFLEVYRNRERYRPCGKFVPYLCRIAINQCRMTIRSRRRARAERDRRLARPAARDGEATLIRCDGQVEGLVGGCRMISRRHAQLRSEELACYLEGELSASEVSRLESMLAESAEARIRLDQLRRIRRMLATPDPELEHIDLVGPLGHAIAAGEARKPVRPRWLVWSACAAAAACVALASTVAIRRGPTESEYREKSAAVEPADHTLAAIGVYRAREHNAPEPIGSEFSRRDGLLISFLNTGNAPFAYLMVFGIDAANEVHWFFPAYIEERTNPMSIPITEQGSQSLLPDVIQHDFASGRLAIYALFLQQPLGVKEVEAWLRAERFRPVRPPLSAAKLQKLESSVNP
jgi:RNA polymerase sigma-70 factor (ECF subfamily)